MRYTPTDNIKIAKTNNELLITAGIKEKLVLYFNYDYISIVCIDKSTGNENILFESITRDESYLWLEGFNQGMLIMSVDDTY
jgi:hypothetical protein